MDDEAFMEISELLLIPLFVQIHQSSNSTSVCPSFYLIERSHPNEKLIYRKILKSCRKKFIRTRN
jgi:hypothetical protein